MPIDAIDFVGAEGVQIGHKTSFELRYTAHFTISHCTADKLPRNSILMWMSCIDTRFSIHSMSCNRNRGVVHWSQTSSRMRGETSGGLSHGHHFPSQRRD